MVNLKQSLKYLETMKKIFLFTLFFQFTTYSQNYKSEQIRTFDYNKLVDSTVYSLDKNELETLLKNNKTEYTILISWGYWCKPCNVFLPKLLKFKSEIEPLLNVWIISVEPDNSKKLFTHKFSLEEKFSYTKPSFVISEIYGKSRFKKYDAFLIDLIGKDKFKNEHRGMSQVIMYKNSDIVFLSDWNMTDEVILENINRLVKS